MIFIMIIIYCHSCHISALERLILHLGILGVNLVKLDVVAGEEGEEDVLHLVVVLLVDVLVAEQEHEAIKHNQPTTAALVHKATNNSSINQQSTTNITSAWQHYPRQPAFPLVGLGAGTGPAQDGPAMHNFRQSSSS